jgi:hypothetical protein
MKHESFHSRALYQTFCLRRIISVGFSNFELPTSRPSILAFRHVAQAGRLLAVQHSLSKGSLSEVGELPLEPYTRCIPRDVDPDLSESEGRSFLDVVVYEACETLQVKHEWLRSAPEFVTPDLTDFCALNLGANLSSTWTPPRSRHL